MKTIFKFKRTKRTPGTTPTSSGFELRAEREYSLVLLNGKLRFVTTDNVRIVPLSA